MARTYNAALKYTQANGVVRGFGLWVNEYSQEHRLAGSQEQSKLVRRFYPRSYSAGAIAVNGRVPTQQRYDQLAEFIRDHHLLMMTQAGASNAGRYQIPLMRLSIPSENIYVEGWIGSFAAGVKRFNVAPEFDLDFAVIKDAHSKNTDLRAAHVVRSWFTGAVINAGQEIHNETDIDVAEGLAYDVYADPTSGKRG